jgi:hypothetical protein
LNAVIARDYHRAVVQTIPTPHVHDRRQRTSRRRHAA